MKKLLTLASVMAALSGVAAAAPYVLPSPQPGALTPYDIQPHYGIDAIYTFAGDSDDPDLYGVRGSFNLYTSGEDTVRHQFNINVTPEFGSKTRDGIETSLFMMPITGGYDLNVAITDEMLFYVGGKAGYAVTHTRAKEKETGLKVTRNDGAFNYSVGGGLKFQPSETLLVKLGYEFGKTYSDDKYEGSRAIYTGHSIIFGISKQF